MSTVVFLHAHPDDETSSTGGTIALLAAAGHTVVVVFATGGEHGEAPADLPPGMSVAAYRRREAQASAGVLGVAAVEWLGYSDSGMTGWAQNSDENSLHTADPEQAGAKLAALLDERGADVLVCYDWHGSYGHPDHVMVHRVGHRAAELAARRPRLLEATMNRDAARRHFEFARQFGQADSAFNPDAPMDDGNPFGEPESEIHWSVDVSGQVDTKRAALACHASQTTDVGAFLALDPAVFALAFGTEYFIEPGRPPGMVAGRWWQ